MGLKVFVFSFCVFGSMYYLHKVMTEKVNQRERIRHGLEDPDEKIDKRIVIGGNWLLKDLEGKEFGSHNLYGSYYLLYFGFSLCPDVCPFSVMTMTKVIRKLRQSREGQQYFLIKPVFVTTNPEYDNPERLVEFAEIFDEPSLILLREENNKAPNLLDILKKFKVPIGLNESER